MSLDDELGRCGLEAHAALDADDGVADVAVATDGVAGADRLNLLYGLHLIVEMLAVDGVDLALFERDAQLGLRLLGGDMLQVSALGQTLRRVEKLTAADARAPDADVVAVLQFGEVGEETMRVEVVDLLLTRQFLVAGEGDDVDARRQHLERHVETNLVVARTGRTVGNGVGTNLLGIAGNGDGLEDALRRY